MHMIREGVKVDCGIKPSDNATGIAGEYFRMDTFAKAKFHGVVRGQLTGATSTLTVYEATDATGSDAAALGAALTFTQGSKVNMAQIACAGTTSVADTLILTPYYFNGEGTLTAGTALTFTAAAAENLSEREWDQSGNATAEGASIAACINSTAYGVPGLLATADTGTVTITCTEPGGGDRQVLCADNGTGAFDITESAVAKLVVTDLIQMADFEVYVQDLDRDDGFTHVGAAFTDLETTTWSCCILERAMAGYGPVGQAVSVTDTSA